jgi:hypothetical protein
MIDLDPAMTRLQLRTNWMIAASRLAAAKTMEAFYRLKIVETEFANADIGTTRSADGVLKVVKKYNYTLDNSSDGDKLVSVLASIAEAYPDIDCSEVFEWKASINAKVYESLPKAVQAMINPVLTIKPAMPTLKLADAKEDE